MTLNWGAQTDPWAADIDHPTKFLSSKYGVSFSVLVDEIEHLTQMAKSKIAEIRGKRSAMSIADMFDLQMAMNKLSQMSEMSTSMISAMNTAIQSMSRNIKA